MKKKKRKPTGFDKYPLVLSKPPKTEVELYEAEAKAKRSKEYLKKLRKSLFR
jgi:hypothetical protein